MKNVPSVGIVVVRDGKVLLVSHGKAASHLTGAMGTPGGRINQGESFIDAAVRELREETGLVTTNDKMLQLPRRYEGDIKRKTGEVVHFVDTVFVCTGFEGGLVTTDETKPIWVSINDLDTMELLPNTKKMTIDGVNYAKNKD